MINHYDHPLALTQNIEVTYMKIREFVKENNDNVKIVSDKDWEIQIQGMGGNSKFYFHIKNPKLTFQGNAVVNYTSIYAPKNSSTLSVNTVSVPAKGTLDHLRHWLSLLQAYDKIRIHPQDNITDQYEEEFEDWFEIAEEDADKKAFDTPRQILITNAITKSILALKEAGYEDDDEIIQDAEELKENISKLTMKQAFDSIKRLYAKLRIKGGLKMTEYIYRICLAEVVIDGYHLVVKNLGSTLFQAFGSTP